MIKNTIMKNVFKYLVAAAAVMLLVVSCKKDEPDDIDASLLPGTWKCRVYQNTDVSADGEYWKFNTGGTGGIWIEAQGQTEDDMQRFNWTLDKDYLILIHYVGEVPSAPTPFTVELLTSAKMKLNDKGRASEFDKVK